MKRRDIAWIVILVVDVCYIAWGAGAAASPDHLLGPVGNTVALVTATTYDRTVNAIGPFEVSEYLGGSAAHERDHELEARRETVTE